MDLVLAFNTEDRHNYLNAPVIYSIRYFTLLATSFTTTGFENKTLIFKILILIQQFSKE